MSPAVIEYISVPKTEYLILKNIYKFNRKRQDFERLYEVEENLKTWNYKTVKASDFINSI